MTPMIPLELRYAPRREHHLTRLQLQRWRSTWHGCGLGTWQLGCKQQFRPLEQQLSRLRQQRRFHRLGGGSVVQQGADSYAEALGVCPASHVVGPFGMQDETVFHGAYRAWKDMLRSGLQADGVATD